ncbi:hypothetical protein ACFWIJ_38425, partial [Streptomyces sp. NPDC127079]
RDTHPPPALWCVVWGLGGGVVERGGGGAAAPAHPLGGGVAPPRGRGPLDWQKRPRPYRTAALARLPLQVPLVLWARGVARNEEGR